MEPAPRRYVKSEPYLYPYNGCLDSTNTALIVIDMQVDFCGKGGYVDLMGYDVTAMQKPVAPIRSVLDSCRKAGMLILHTREGHRPELADLAKNKKWRSEQIGAGIGSPGPCGRVLIRGEPGWEIIPDLAPLPGECVIDKPGKGSFIGTDLDLILRNNKIQNVILTGITTDVCVHTTMRAANDLGYECLLLEDCCAATDPKNHYAAVDMVKKQGGVFGAVSNSVDFIASIEPGAHLEKPLTVASDPGCVTIDARPYQYVLPVKATALIMIDFQRDFMEPGGFGSTLGNKVELLQESVPGAARLLAACRAAGISVVHTLEAHKADMSDLHPAKYWRGGLPPNLRIGAESDMGRILIRDEAGNGIIDALAPIDGEKCLHKPGKGAFYATDLEEWLVARGITHLLFAGVTTEVCVQTSMREANDRGFDSLLVTDATASYFPEFKKAAIEMIVAQGGIVGWTADSLAVASALSGISPAATINATDAANGNGHA